MRLLYGCYELANLLQRHSEVPEKDEDWPSLGSIISFRDRVRARLVKLYDDIHNGRRALNRHLARMLAMTHEHEGWHVEVGAIFTLSVSTA